MWSWKRFIEMVERVKPRRQIDVLRQQRRTGEGQRYLRSRGRRVTENNLQEVVRDYQNAINTAYTRAELQSIYNQAPSIVRARLPNINQIKTVQEKNLESLGQEKSRVQNLIKRNKNIINNTKSSRVRQEKRAEIRGYEEQIKFLDDTSKRITQGERLSGTDALKISREIKQGQEERKLSSFQKSNLTRQERQERERKAKGADLTRTTLKLGGQVITGFTNVRTGEFLPSGIGDNKRKFDEIKTAFGTNKTKEIREIATRPEVKRELSKLKTEARKLSVARSKQLINEARAKRYIDNINKTGKKPNARELFKLGFNSEQVTQIISAYETGAGLKGKQKLDVSKIFENLTPTRTTDYNTQVSAFKIQVNKILEQAGEKKVPLTSPVSSFEKAYSKLLKQREENLNKIVSGTKKDLTRQIKNNLFSIENKLRTKQTLTPNELKILANNQSKLKDDFKKNLVTRLIKKPAEYVAYLSIRQKQGEKNPLLKDVRSFGRGVSDSLIKPFVELGKFVAVTVPQKSGAALGRYSADVSKEGLTKIKSDIKKVAEQIIKRKIGAGKTPSRIGNAIKEIQKNENLAKLILYGGLIAAPLAFGKIIKRGGESVTQFYKKNPAYALGFAVGALVPIPAEKIRRVTSAVNQRALRVANTVISDVERILPRLRPISYTGRYTANVNTATGGALVRYVINGLLENNKKFNAVLTLRLDNISKSVLGNIKTTVGGRTSTRNINLRDEGAFFIDKATNTKFPKTTLSSRQFVENVKRIKLKQEGQLSRISPTFEGQIRFSRIKKERERLVGTEKGRVALTQTKAGRLEEAKGISTATKKYIQEKREKVKSAPIKTIFRKNRKQRTPLDDEKIRQFLEFIDYDKDIINGIDKRTRLALTLGLNKKSVQNLQKKIDQDILEGYIQKVKSNAIFTGEFRKFRNSKFGLGVSFLLDTLDKIPNLTGKGARFLINKKAQAKLPALQRQILSQLKIKNNKISSPELIRIKTPSLDSFIYVPRKLGRLKLPRKNLKIGLLFSKVANLYKRLYNIKTSTVLKLENKFAESLKKASEVIKIKTSAKKSVQKTTPQTKTVSKVKQTQRTRTKQVPKIKSTAPRKPRLPKLIRTPRGRLKAKLPTPNQKRGIPKLNKGERYTYDIFLGKTGSGKKALLKTKLPKNLALKKAYEAISSGKFPLGQSFTLRIAGKTAKSDIRAPQRVLRRIRTKKSQNPKVENFVEKRKYILETRQEKAALKAKRKKK